ncbi:LLM class flavin-dependent oxidoreductase [Nocardia sp. NPDC005978]|uniref:LLM class flavin-dependent oxidoreductase n=1 Tax=Nocardia sp. NPDC005978 TaxID=3156725 RepID=UPI0033AA6A60
MPVSIGVFLPTSGPHHIGGAEIRAAARAAEDAGLESLWATDHLIASQPMLDSTVALTTAAAVTDRINIGFGAMLVALRPVAWAAKQVATLQQLSGNRVLLGIGTGNPAHGDIGWRAAGVPFAERGLRTDRALTHLPALISGDPAPLADDLHPVLSPPSPVPPILIAGNSSRARARAAAHGDAWMPIDPAPADLPALLTDLKTRAAQHNRPTPTITVVAPTLPADPRAAADHLAAYESAGVTRVILSPTTEGGRTDYAYAAALRAAQ